MLIWQGWGILSVILPVLGYMGMAALVRALTSPDYLTLHSWPGALGTLLGAAAVYFLGISLRSKGRTLLDPATGQTIVLRRRNSIFWIPMEYAGIILSVVALGILLLKHESTI